MIVTVVGAGVIGLTTAVALAERGFPTRVVAADLPRQTTSATAGAIWGPYRAGPAETVDRWSATSLQSFADLAGEAAAGVRMVFGIEVARRPVDPPRWRHQLPHWRRCLTDELPLGAVTGWRFVAPVIDMPVYLDYLVRRLVAAAGELMQASVASLDDVGDGGVVVNCAGYGARLLAHDQALLPVRGQQVVVANPGVTEFLMEDVGASSRLVGIYPQGSRVVLGGTAIRGSDDRSVDLVAARHIVARCAEYVPSLATAQVLEHRVGVRPVRSTVRLEVRRLPSGRWCAQLRPRRRGSDPGGGLRARGGASRRAIGRLNARSEFEGGT